MDIKRYKVEAADSFLITIDIQERLAPAIDQTELCQGRALRMLEAAALFGIPGAVTEQYPRGLGESLPSIKTAYEKAEHACFDKTEFQATIAPVMEKLEASGRKTVIVTGMETHICVYQTVRNLLALGYRVFVPADAVGSRTAENKANALAQFTQMGAVVTNTETLLYDLLGSSKAPQFKAVSAMVK